MTPKELLKALEKLADQAHRDDRAYTFGRTAEETDNLPQFYDTRVAADAAHAALQTAYGNVDEAEYQQDEETRQTANQNGTPNAS